ncbi:conjugal transfer protein [Sporosarcina luteola]|uniref:TcpE family conjugal transfer membrane protein n=1 Tax=Sporosarcina luteola TaxID=582850 RepID=UPI00203DEAC3|nr:conjugal transfer protein [Sporosarcina luteola]
MLNNFIRFERQLYQIFGLELGRPLRLKAVMYFILIALVEAAIYFTPGIGRLINWIPVGILILIPIGLAWLLADVGTEGRSPIHFFRSFITYQIRKLKNNTFYRGREVEKERDYQFHNYYTYAESNWNDELFVLPREVDEEHAKAMNYLARVLNEDPKKPTTGANDEMEGDKIA